MFFFKQKTAYEMRISDCNSDVCSSVLFRLADTIAKCESAAIHAPSLRQHPEDYSEHARARVDAGFLIPATAYLDAQRLRGRHLRELLQSAFSKVEERKSGV